MTPAQFRKLALSMPGAEELSHMAHPDFRANGKIFAGLTKDEKTATLKLTPDVQATILDDASGAFAPAAGAWGRGGWTQVLLAKAPAAMMKSLVSEAWSNVAPKPKKKAATAPKARRSPPRRS